MASEVIRCILRDKSLRSHRTLPHVGKIAEGLPARASLLLLNESLGRERVDDFQ
eukprot:CAMPEP_0174909428 /NCGR_PEP_ID=MMETSP0167-20121228/68542_1 /TAXON_ID=38298 /ORGANISM="Rhodella maculata, Strain CCMP736" /LENGTH=53 /DNA_ID=CAMNT_0016153431 /DNA_START=91 /DNA_END=249 /DNA_ORIENTATION=+